MTTNFSTIKFALSKFYCRGVSHENLRFGTISSLLPRPAPLRSANSIFIVVSPSLSCQSWQSRVADFFCYFWAVFSKRTLALKVLSGRVRSRPCPSHQEQLRDCKGISAWEPRPCLEGSQRVSQNPCSEDASKSKPSEFSIEKSAACTMPVFGKIFHNTLQPKPAVSKFQVQRRKPP